jgi:DNA-binding CsgD family transcriptional regulator
MLGDLLERAGSETFARGLFDLAREHAGIDQLTIYEYVRGTPATVLVQEALHGDAALAVRTRKLAESAFVGHAAYDEPTPPGRQLRVHVLEVACVSDGGDDGGQLVRSTIALVLKDPAKDPDKHLVVHFARYPPSEAFAEDEKHFVFDHAAMIAEAVERHCDSLRSPTFPRVSAWARYLEEIPGSPPLSPQEALVCAYGLLGFSKTDTAARMGLSAHSVSAYRRRAYAKLNITSQIELASLLLLSPPAGARG